MIKSKLTLYKAVFVASQIEVAGKKIHSLQVQV